jgi:hypothetical protein
MELCTTESQIRELGPPPNGFRFPLPVGLRPGSHRSLELLEAGQVPVIEAWKAVVARLNEIDNVHGEGESWLRVSVECQYSDPDGQGNEFTRPFVGDQDTITITRNFDIGTEGLRRSGEEQRVQFRGYQLRGGPGGTHGVGETTTIDRETGRASREYGAESTGPGAGAEIGWSEHTARFEVGDVEAGLSDDGRMKFGYEGHVVSHDLNTGNNSIDLASFEIPWLGSINVQWCWRMNSLETLERIMSNGPGFFETRPTTQLLARATQWNDLSLDEQLRLAALGWDQARWDRRHLLPLSQFPRACRVAARDLSAVERGAAIHSWFTLDDWPLQWRGTCRQPPDLPPPDSEADL